MKRTSFDPRVPLILAMTISTLSVVFRSPYWLGGLAAATFFILLCFRIPFPRKNKSLSALLLIFAVLPFLQSLLGAGGKTVLNVRGTAVLTERGLILGIAGFLRMTVIIFSALLLSTIEERDLLQGLRKWRIPYEIIFMVRMGLRFFPLLKEEVNDIHTSLQLKGIKMEELPLRKRVKLYTCLLLPLIARIIQKIHETSLVMELRGFGAGRARTSYYQIELKRRDRWAISASIVTGIASAFLYFCT